METPEVIKLVDERVKAALHVHEYEMHKQRNPHFKPPTRAEVEAYKREKNLPLDAQEFMDFYESNGWRVGRNPMKDWKAAARRAAREWCKGKPPIQSAPEPTAQQKALFAEREHWYRQQTSEKLQEIRGKGLHAGAYQVLIDTILRERRYPQAVQDSVSR